jgi:hypothetical protein
MTGWCGHAAALHRDDDGQISALGVIAAGMFASLLVLVINTGYETSRKIQLQNTADATAISGATWVARGLNLVSLNNVTQTQLLALYLLIPSIDQAAEAAQVVLEAEIAVCGLAGPFAPACLIPLEIQMDALIGFRAVISGVKAATGDGRVFWTMMQTLGAFSTAIVQSFPLLAEGEAIRIAQQNEADVGLLIPAPSAAGGYRVSLPARRGALRPDLCDPTHNGSPRVNSRGYTPLYGYDIGEGTLDHLGKPIRWTTWFWINTGMPWFFDAFKEANYRELCGGSGAAPTYERPVRTLGECRAADGTAYWLVRYFNTQPLPTPQPGVGTIEADDPRLADGNPITARTQTSCRWTPPGTPSGTNAWRTVAESREVTGTDADGRPVVAYRYQVIEYRFVRGGISTRAGAAPTTPPTDGDPYPYLLGSSPADDEAIRSELRYLAITYRTRDVWVAPAYFLSPLGARRVTYAQAKVYNSTAFDLFTQDWRVSLEPASMIDDHSVGRAVSGGAVADLLGAVPAAAAGAGDVLGLFTSAGAGLLGAVNNH